MHKSDRSHVVLWAKELPSAIVFLRPLGLRLGYLIILDDIERSFYDEIQKQCVDKVDYDVMDWEATISLQLEYAQ